MRAIFSVHVWRVLEVLTEGGTTWLLLFLLWSRVEIQKRFQASMRPVD